MHCELKKHGFCVLPVPLENRGELVDAAIRNPVPFFDPNMSAFDLKITTGWSVDPFTPTAPEFLTLTALLAKLMGQMIARMAVPASAAIHQEISARTNTEDPRQNHGSLKHKVVIGKADRPRRVPATKPPPHKPQSDSSVINNAIKLGLHIDSRDDYDNGNTHISTIYAGRNTRSIVLLDMHLVRNCERSQEIFEILAIARKGTGFWNKWTPEQRQLIKDQKVMRRVHIPENHILVFFQELPHCQTVEKLPAACYLCYMGLVVGTRDSLLPAQKSFRDILLSGDVNRDYMHLKAGASRVFQQQAMKLVDPVVRKFYTKEGKFTYSPTNQERNQLPSRKRFREDVLTATRQNPPGRLAKYAKILDDKSARLPDPAIVESIVRMREIAYEI